MRKSNWEKAERCLYISTGIKLEKRQQEGQRKGRLKDCIPVLVSRERVGNKTWTASLPSLLP